MMWHTANSQLHFTNTYWPAFNEAELNIALKDYAERDRRFGA
jgi:undecaprenyl diphosphate synthase